MQAYKVFDDILTLSNYLKRQQIPDYEQWYMSTVSNMLQDANQLSPEQSSELYIGELQRQNFHQAVLTVFDRQVDHQLAMLKNRDPENFDVWYKSTLAERINFARDIYENKNYTDALEQFDEIKLLLAAKSIQYDSTNNTTEATLDISLLQINQNMLQTPPRNSTLLTHPGYNFHIQTNQITGWFSYALEKCYKLIFFTSHSENVPYNPQNLDNHIAATPISSSAKEEVDSSNESTKKPK